MERRAREGIYFQSHPVLSHSAKPMIIETVKNAAKHCERQKGRKENKRVLDRNYIQKQVQTTNSRGVLRQQQRKT